MLSMPPATIISADPAEIRSCASMTAFMPEPHILLTVVAVVDFGKPAPRAAWRAGAWPWPAGSTQPKITSSISFAFTPACSTAALIAVAPRSGAATELNLPCMAPMGVLLAPTMTMFSIWILLVALDRFLEELAPDQHAADLVGSRADVVKLGVAQQAS